MSRYAYLVAPESKQMVFLGKIIEPQPPKARYFHMGPEEDRNSENVALMKVIMKFLAQNLNKQILVLSEEEVDKLKLEPLTSIGHDPAQGILASDYIVDFLG